MDFDSAVKTINNLLKKKQPHAFIVPGYENALRIFIVSFRRT
jgi:hypothetical protein